MSKVIKLGVLALFAFVFSTKASASATSTMVGYRIKVKSAADCRTGEWLNNFSVAKKYAVDNGLPFFAFWTNGENCSHCVKFEGCVNASAFRNWMVDSGIVFWFGYNGDSSSEDRNDGVGYNWVYQGQSLYPLVRMYWRAKKGTVLADGTVLTADKVIVDKSVMGDDLDSRLKASEGGTAKVLSRVKSYYKQYVPATVSSYKGGEFAVPALGSVGLQAEVGLTSGDFTVPLTRTNTTVQADVATNLVAITAGGKTETNTVVWASNATTAEVSFALPTTMKAGDTYTLNLLDAESGETKDSATVKVVAAQKNSPSNPYWLGERTAPGAKAAGAALDWGEWTVDLDAAKAKAKADGGTTLVLVGGTTWCPDCVATEHYLLERDEFKAWCVANKVTLAVVDVPNYNGSQTSSLLSYDVNDTLYNSSKKTYDNYRYVSYNYSGVTNMSIRYQSGAGYLSRHNLTPSDPDVVALKEKFRKLACDTIAAGGLKRPETTTARMGVPTFIALRSDGTVAGRLTAFSASGAQSYTEGYLTRFSELLAQASDAEEENNDNPKSATAIDPILSRGMVAGIKTISAVDVADYYPIDESAVGPVVKFSLAGATAGTEDALLTLSVCNNAKSTLETIATATTNLGAGVELTCTVPNTNCFLKVEYPRSSANYGLAEPGTYFDFTKVGSTVCSYTISTDCVLTPTETNQLFTVNDGVATVTIAVTEGTTYKFLNVKASDEGFLGHFDEGASADLYIAKATESASVPLSDINEAFQYRIWNTGKIGFATGAASVSEKDASYTVELVRRGGSAGVAKMKLHLDSANSSQLDEVFELGFADGLEFAWADGETDVKTAVIKILDNAYSDGNQHVRLYVDQEAGTSDAGIQTASFDLTIREDDAAVVGKLALAGVAPLEAKTGVVYARQGEEITLGVKRVGGTAGVIAGKVTASVGTISTSDFGWKTRESETQPFKLTVPAASNVKLTLAGVDGAKVDSASRYLTVYPVAANAPQFETASLSISATRYVVLPETTVAIDPAYLDADGEISVAKVSGALPAGLKAKLNGAKDALVISGVPTKAGVTKAVYRVSKGAVKGLTVTIDFSVTDPVVAATAGAAPVNAAVAKTRSFSDILIVDTDSTNLVGVLSLSIPRTGKLSAKIRYVDSDFGTVTFASTNWSSIEEDGSLVADIVNKATGYTLTVTVAPDGTMTLGGLDDDVSYRLPSEDEVFSTNDPATDWKGVYTVSMPVSNPDSKVLARGAGYMVLKMSTAVAARKGRMTYAGLLPNGKGFSGTAYLQPTEWDDTLATPAWAKAYMAFLLQSSTDGLGGVLEIDRAKAVGYGKSQREVITVAAEDGVPFAIPHWIHRETVTDEADYEADLGIFGGKYVSTENWKEFYTSYYALEGKTMSFFAEPQQIAFSDNYGPASAWDLTGYGVTLGYTAKTKVNAFARQATGAAAGFSLAFDSANGIVKGKFRVQTENGNVTMTYRAIVLPGWGASGCTDCAVGIQAAPDRPFVSGAAWCKDAFTYDGAARTTKVIRGCDVSIGLEAGK